MQGVGARYPCIKGQLYIVLSNELPQKKLKLLLGLSHI